MRSLIWLSVRVLVTALSEQNSKYLERPYKRSDRLGKMQENQRPRNPVLTFWQSKRFCSDTAITHAAKNLLFPNESVRPSPTVNV